MRTCSLALMCVAAIGCGEDTTLNGVFPASGFIGRSMRVEVTADNASFGSSTTVDFGPGITVSSVHVASPTALFAEIVIADSVPAGLRDVVVHSGDTLTLDDAFQVESPIKVEFKGSLAQGSLATFTIRNLDFENPFDDTCTAPSLFGCGEYGNVILDAPPGTMAQLDSVAPYTLSGTLYMDTDAASGPFRVNSGDPAATPVVSTIGGDLEITARTAMALTGNASGSLEDAYGTHLYSYDAGANAVNQLAITGASGAYILAGTGRWADSVTAGADPTFITQAAGSYYVVVTDLSGDAGVSYSVTAAPLTLTPVAEADTGGANDTQNNAQDLGTNTSALVTNASLSDDTDADWYEFTVPAGSTTKKVHVLTAGGDPYTDTAVIIYGANGTTSLLPMADPDPVDADYHEHVVSVNLGSNNSFFVKIEPSSYFDPTEKNYIMAVWLE